MVFCFQNIQNIQNIQSLQTKKEPWNFSMAHSIINQP